MSSPRSLPTAGLNLCVQSPHGLTGLPTRPTLRRWVLRALQDTPQAAITLRFASRREAQHLNQRYRQKSYVPNVLTFHYASAPQLIADIVLCLPVIKDEARAQSKSLRAHLAHLVIHGVLHARGFDHTRVREAQRMQKLETELLASLRIADPYTRAPSSIKRD